MLVYMFDRMGRHDDETLFVVEWFAKQGIEVWSTQEGEQRFENQTDKLLKLHTILESNGECVKPLMRLKTGMAQLTAEGIYHGGQAVFGYEAIHKGQTNKKGQPVKNLEVVPQEAEIVRMMNPA